jgi:hypothetical protein
MSDFKAKNSENQPLIDALLELAKAQAERHAEKSGYKSIALRTAARNLAKLDRKISDGASLAQSGPHKVKGVGKGTAYYIDEFLKSGKIAEIEQIKRQTEGTKKNPVTPERNINKKVDEDGDSIEINRAPVLTLWVVVVAERQGYSNKEALTYGKWISGIFAQAKGRKEGRFAENMDEPEQKRQRTEKDYISFFGHVKVPVQIQANGDRLAVTDGEVIDHVSVEQYLEMKFGDRLVDAKEAMEVVANSMSGEELSQRAYSLYEQLRPEYKGWGKKSVLKLQEIRKLAAK